MKTLIALLLAAVAVTAAAQMPPPPDHIVIVIEENKGYSDVIKSPNAPYINALAKAGANFTNYHGLHHPSQPNYLELFSGSNHGVCDDTCPPPGSPYATGNLAAALTAKSLTFAGYAEQLPNDLAFCTSDEYARKHCPWLDFSGIPASMSFDTARFPQTAAGFAALPTISFVIPDLLDDMHYSSGTTNNIPIEVKHGDAWLKKNLGAYATWAMTHNSLLVVTWDEDSSHYGNPCPNGIDTPSAQYPNLIPTIIVGQHVKAGGNGTMYTHYNLLRTIEDIYGLTPLGGSANAQPIAGIWK